MVPLAEYPSSKKSFTMWIAKNSFALVLRAVFPGAIVGILLGLSEQVSGKCAMTGRPSSYV